MTAWSSVQIICDSYIEFAWRENRRVPWSSTPWNRIFVTILGHKNPRSEVVSCVLVHHVKTQWWYSFTEITVGTQTYTHVHTWPNNYISIMCKDYGGWCSCCCCCLVSPSTAQDHSADDSSPSFPPPLYPSLPVYWHWERKRSYSPNPLSSILSPFYRGRTRIVYSPLLGLRNVCPSASQSMDEMPSSLPVSCSQPLDGDAQLTNTSQLPPSCSHMTWATTI